MPLNDTTTASWSIHDYISPGLEVVRLDDAFPNMRAGDAFSHPWKYLRRDVPHTWYVDERFPLMGFVSRDEAMLLHNIALQFAGRRALEIGSWLGWSTCHLATAGVALDVIDPAHDDPEIRASVENSLARCGVRDRVNLAGGRSPATIAELGQRWSLFFIDGDHESPAPRHDTIAALPFAEEDCAFVFHDLASPAVAAPLQLLQERGFNVLVYQTAQIMAIAWRGNVAPVAHVPDPQVAWQLPPHLAGFPVSGIDTRVPALRTWPALRDRKYHGAASRPSVCIVTSELIGPFKNGGAGTATTGLAELLASDGLEVTVLYTGTIWSPEARLEGWREHYASRGIDLIALSLEETKSIDGWARRIGFVTPWLIYEKLRTRHFDVIHFNDCCGEGSLCLAAKEAGIAFEDTLLAVALHSPSRWVYELNHLLPGRPGYAAFDDAERISLACADLLWSPSRYLLEWAAKQGYELPRQTFVQQYTLPPTQAASDIRRGRTAPPDEIVFFGRLEERKGLRLFCNAIDRIATDLASRGISVTFLGKPAECGGLPALEYVAKRTASWQLPVKTLTDLGQPEALQFLAEGRRLAVMASPADNSPCTVYEALEAGIPFLAARTGGIPELVAPPDRAKVLFEHTTAALSHAILDAVTSGGWIASAAVSPEVTRRAWLDMHAHWRELNPRNSDEPAPQRPRATTTVAAIIEHRAGGSIGRTMESLWACPAINQYIILNRSGEALPWDNVDLMTAEAEEIEKTLSLQQDAALLIHSGVRVVPDAFDEMLSALQRGTAEGFVPAARVTGTLGSRVIPPVGSTAPIAFLEGVTSGGAVLLSSEALRRAMSHRPLAPQSPFAGLADFCVADGAKVRPYPAVVAERDEAVVIEARSAFPARIAAYGAASPIDRYYMLAAGYEAATTPRRSEWMRRAARVAVDSGFSFAVRAAAWGRRRWWRWVGR